MPAVLRRAASGPQAARHAGPLESFKEFPGHEDRSVNAVRFRPGILAGACSGRLVEAKAFALVSDARSAQAPGSVDSRESRLNDLAHPQNCRAPRAGPPAGL